ncbi:uncharacterized protein L969DRAFT_95532 [Mixia osmundae IAM 14324]|uniref:Uncharacterized protein n=1 Tax=Mixia osmundae (strain CBS 9802 / IAM 14324 / JCM 22182 / KY 12970) TaxID=764103 RepID=G7E7P3_MIXOS|nr:uncharacterized protein L969DRAFT_95532 [Mixia osmundae IAM 14324]KEI38453.1 hypothetical protein L969DRAFT_95532 [Mixia osmundae IAM 14324]GAA98853.1 hypothetical protein E5Q_05541 [Mixia osmundae IAM 14324]
MTPSAPIITRRGSAAWELPLCATSSLSYYCLLLRRNSDDGVPTRHDAIKRVRLCNARC